MARSILLLRHFANRERSSSFVSWRIIMFIMFMMSMMIMIFQTRVRSLSTHFSNKLLLLRFDWCDPLLTQNLLMLLLLVGLMLKNMITTVWSRFWSQSLVKILRLKFGQLFERKNCSDFVQKVGQEIKVDVQLILWSWSFVNILMLMFGWTSKLKLGRDFEGLCKNLWYDLKAATLVKALNPWVSYAFGLWQWNLA